MKQLRKLSLVLVIMFTSVISFSTGYSIIPKGDSNRVSNVVFTDVMEGSLFSIVDINGIILYKEVINNTGNYSKRLDLTNLPDANYYFEIDNLNEIEIIPFSVIENIAIIQDDKKATISKPVITVKDNLVYISKELVGKQSLEIEIYYEGYDLAYSEKFKEAYSLSRVYDFSTSKKGRYTIFVKSEGRSFKNTINI